MAFHSRKFVHLKFSYPVELEYTRLRREHGAPFPLTHAGNFNEGIFFGFFFWGLPPEAYGVRSTHPATSPERRRQTGSGPICGLVLDFRMTFVLLFSSLFMLHDTIDGT